MYGLLREAYDVPNYAGRGAVELTREPDMVATECSPHRQEFGTSGDAGTTAEPVTSATEWDTHADSSVTVRRIPHPTGSSHAPVQDAAEFGAPTHGHGGCTVPHSDLFVRLLGRDPMTDAEALSRVT